MTRFIQTNHKTGVKHTVVIQGTYWYSFSLPRKLRHHRHDSAPSFQRYFGCSDAEMMLITLKYGSPLVTLQEKKKLRDAMYATMKRARNR